jgi:hypothetical protein
VYDEQDLDASLEMVSEGCPNADREEDEEEEERLRQAQLHDWWKEVLGNENNLHLALDLASGNLTAAEWARSTKRHRSSALRQMRKLFLELGERVRDDCRLQALMPSPWRERYFGSA